MKKLIANLTCDSNKKRHSKVPFLLRCCPLRVANRTQALLSSATETALLSAVFYCRRKADS